MPYNLNLHVETFIAGTTDAPLAQFRAVVLNSTTGHVEYPAGRSNGNVLGITQDNLGVAAGDAVQVGPALNGGITKVEAGEAITLGEFISFGADGRAELADTTGDVQYGIALEAASAAGEIIAMKFTGFLGTHA